MTALPQHTTLQRRRRWAGPGFEAFGSIFAFVYTFLAGNVMLALANAPLVFCLALVAALSVGFYGLVVLYQHSR